ncbi:sugar kinase [Virgibacillus sp. NKC19-3]|uniref:sugar kinase n=1 Tax=Virgibacillus saliphilus TaxID=2831674 RepID=UPI001C9A9957|nr:sugar kinase [Virgibacillus sp. NKC19-3]MBY7144210.1 sugar kinase [Virgibacillus sp. NKC19-3]
MDVVTLGETMVLFTPEISGYMRYAGNFSTKVAGAESNLAIGLARLGHNSSWVSRLGDDEFGKKILSFIRGEGVDVSRVSYSPSASTGLYFKEMITDDEVRVQYYRKDSAASRMKPSDLHETHIKNAKYLHLTGITPALSESCYETVMKAIEIATSSGVTVVFDPNLRRKLWPEDHAQEVLLEIAAKADIVLPGLDEGQFLFGDLDAETTARHFFEHGPSLVVLKLGAEGAYYYSDKEQGRVAGFPVHRVVDPVGAGDGFAAGLLSGLLDSLSLEKAVERAAAVGALVTMVKGDVEGLPDRSRLNAFIEGKHREGVNR